MKADYGISVHSSSTAYLRKNLRVLRAASSVSYATLPDLRWKYIAVNVIFHGRFCFCSSLGQKCRFLSQNR